MKNKESIFQAASDQKKKNLFKIRSGAKALYRALLANFNDARTKGHHVDFIWLWSKGCKIYREQEGNEKTDLKKTCNC